MGAATNAATSKESTHLHARLLDEHTEEAFELLAEMLLGPSLPADEVDSEREVVLEEIAMYEDEPQDRVHDVLAQAIHGDHPLGRRVLGDAEVIASIPVPDIAAYHDDRYTAPNVVVAAAGHLEHAADRRARPAAHRSARRRAARAAQRRPSRARRDSRSRPRTPSSTTSASAARASPVRTIAASRSASSTPSSAARRRRGCFARFARSGAWRTRSAPTPSSTPSAARSPCTSAPARRTSARPARSSARELGEPPRPSGVTAEELERAKEHVKGRMVLGLEATGRG